MLKHNRKQIQEWLEQMSVERKYLWDKAKKHGK